MCVGKNIEGKFLLMWVALILCLTPHVNGMVAAKSNAIDEEVGKNNYKIGFEKNESSVWTLLGGFSEITTNASQVLSGNQSLAIDTTSASNMWRTYLRINGLSVSKTYSLQLNYRVIKSPSYFYIYSPSEGNSHLLDWSGYPGYEGRADTVFTTGASFDGSLIFGMKEGGSVIVDNIIVTPWNSEEEAELELKASKIILRELVDEAKVMKGSLAGLESKLSSMPHLQRERVAKFRQIQQVDVKLGQLDKLVCKKSLRAELKVECLDRVEELRRDIFKLNALTDHLLAENPAEQLSFLTFTDHSLKKLRRDIPYDYVDKPRKKIELFCAKNESESFQVVVVPLAGNISGLSIEASDIKSDRGYISNENIKWNQVGYVQTVKELYPVEHVGWWADPLIPAAPTDIPATYCAQPFWVTVYVPADANAGEYEGRLTVTSSDGSQQVIELKVNVWDFSLPLQSAFKTSFPVWHAAHAEQVSTMNSLEDYYIGKGLLEKDDPRTDQVRRMYREELLRHRISPARIATDPPRKIMREDGAMYLDFSQYDKDLEHYQSLGLNSFTFGGYWGWRNHLKGERQEFTYFPEGKDESVTIVLDVLSDPYKRIMKDYFKSWVDYFEARGCVEEAYCYINDEPFAEEEERVNELFDVMHEIAPELKLIVPALPQIGHNHDAFENLGIMCPLLSKIDVDLAEKSKTDGKSSWWYVCMSPRHPYPNFFTDYPAIDHRIIMWMSWKYKVEGLLYYATSNWWGVDPWENPETYPTTHGDGVLFYPSKTSPIEVVSTIRLAVIRDGIDDYDYLAILKGLVDRAEAIDGFPDKAILNQAKELLKVPDEIVLSTSSYTESPQRLLRRRILLGNITEKLAGLLGEL